MSQLASPPWAVRVAPSHATAWCGVVEDAVHQAGEDATGTNFHEGAHAGRVHLLHLGDKIDAVFQMRHPALANLFRFVRIGRAVQVGMDGQHRWADGDLRGQECRKRCTRRLHQRRMEGGRNRQRVDGVAIGLEPLADLRHGGGRPGKRALLRRVDVGNGDIRGGGQVGRQRCAGEEGDGHCAGVGVFRSGFLVTRIGNCEL